MRKDNVAVRIGLLWRADGDAGAAWAKVEERLGPLVAALRALLVVIEHVPYADDAVDDVRAQLLACDVVMVWVNPIQDGQNRAVLDALLREVSDSGVLVSAHPDTILKLGTKEVLYHARGLEWGSDVELYQTADDFLRRFPSRLATYGQLVVKQARGNGGNGVWKVDLPRRPTTHDPIDSDTPVIVRDARVTDGSSEQMVLGEFLALAGRCFGWSSCLIDQPFQDRLAEGMLRCYFSRDQVVGFARQWPRRGLLAPEQARAAASASATVMEAAEASAYQVLRQEAETRWLPALLNVLELDARALPLIWDADFLFGPPTASGEDTYVLCEINTSAVWPFPPTAAGTVARAAVAATESTRRQHP